MNIKTPSLARSDQKDGPATGTLATRRQRENILQQILKTAGNEPLGRIDRKAIIAGRERRAKTPFQARHFLDTMRGFFQWALENEHIKSDPTEGLKITKRLFGNCCGFGIGVIHVWDVDR